jgi:hypothetical protein
MSRFDEIAWDAEALEAEMRRSGGRSRGGGAGLQRPNVGGARKTAKGARWSGLAQRGIRGGGWRRRPHRRPWIFGPWAAAYPLWTAAPEEPAPPPLDEPAAPDEPAPPEGADSGPPEEEPASELEVRRTVAPLPGPVLRIEWTPVITIAAPRRSLPSVAGGGIYLVVDKADAPIYVGETASFAGRWSNPRNGRLHELAQLGLPQPCCPVRVYFGRLTSDATTRKGVEHTIIRTLINGGLGAALANTRSKAPFRVRTGLRIERVLPESLAGRVRITDARKASFYRANALDIPDGASYELAVGG